MNERRTNRPLAIALLLCGGLLIALSGHPTDAFAVAALFAAAATLPRFRADTLAQLALALLLPAAAWVLIFLIENDPTPPPPGFVGPVSRAACLGFLAVAALRLRAVRAPRGGDAVTAGIGFLALLPLGAPSRGLLFPVFSPIILLLLLVGLNARSPMGLSRSLFERDRGPAVRILSVSAAVAALLTVALPFAYERAMHLIESSWETPETGFGFDLRIGSLSGLGESNTPVMRLRGRRADYLCGAVYTRYRNGRWLAPARGRQRPLHLPENSEAHVSSTLTSDRTEIRYLDDTDRFFLPRDAAPLLLRPDRVEQSDAGILRTTGESPAAYALFSRGATDRTLPPNDPTLTEVPPALAPFLADITHKWRPNDPEPAAFLHEIERRLRRDFTYSLHVSVPPGKDPVRWFLTQGRTGWCETFASAMVLIARARGIPARVVGGYRVHEYNPVGDFYIVREKNAHAWVEAYVPGSGWTRFDPTPSEGEVADTRTGLFSALLDAGADALDRMILRPIHIIAVVVLLVLLWVVIRLLRRLRARTAPTENDGPRYTPPPVEIAALLRSLSDAGLPRAPNEPLERYVRRLSDALPETSPFAAAPTVLAAHVTRRYGPHPGPPRMDDWKSAE